MYIAVGPDQRRFGVHKGRISCYSTFFKALFSGSFKEASSDTVLLPDDDPEIFDIVHIWLTIDCLTQSVNGEDVDCTSRQLIDVFIFGDKYGMPELRNMAINCLIEWVAEKQGLTAHFAHAYEHTTKNSPLRRLLVDVFAFLPESWAETARAQYDLLLECPEFVTDVAIKLGDGFSRRVFHQVSMAETFFIKDACEYHDHGEGVGECTILHIPKNRSFSSLKLVQD